MLYGCKNRILLLFAVIKATIF